MGYLNLWDIFRFIFDFFTFFHKIIVAEKIVFLQMDDAILQRVK